MDGLKSTIVLKDQSIIYSLGNAQGSLSFSTIYAFKKWFLNFKEETQWNGTQNETKLKAEN